MHQLGHNEFHIFIIQSTVCSIRVSLKSLFYFDSLSALLQPHELWSVCLLLLQFSQHDVEGDVKQVWDLILKRAYDGARTSSVPDPANPSTSQTGNAAFTRGEGLRCACMAVQDLSLRLYPSPWCVSVFNNDVNFDQIDTHQKNCRAHGHVNWISIVTCFC